MQGANVALARRAAIDTGTPSLACPCATIRHHNTLQATMTSTQSAPVALPRVAITYCTQCRWMLRAAYFGQELLSTFGNQIGEIALIPATGGLFTVELVRWPSLCDARNRG